jgi:hypothetical protein
MMFMAWGDEDVVLERIAGACRVDFVRRRIALEYACSPAETVRLFLDWYGPTVRASATLDAARQIPPAWNRNIWTYARYGDRRTPAQ